MAQQPRRGHPALLWGVLFGALLAVLVILDRFFLAGILRRAGLTGGSLGAALIAQMIFFAVALALFFVAGLLAARRAGTVEAGLYAGLLAGLIGGIVALVLSVLFVAGAARHMPAALRLPRPQALRARAIYTALLAGGLVRSVLGVIAATVIGGGMGALGGLAGRGHPPAGPYPYQPPMYPPAGAAPPASTPAGTYPPAGSYSGAPMPPPVTPGNDAPTLQSWPPQQP
jgi:hypothetical protein